MDDSNSGMTHTIQDPNRDTAARVVGAGAFGALLVLAALLYCNVRHDVRSIDLWSLYVLVGMASGALFTAIDPISRNEFRWGKVISFAGGAAVSLGTMYFAKSIASDILPHRHLIITMDSPYRVYDSVTHSNGATNGHDIRDHLAVNRTDLDIILESTSPSWNGFGYVKSRMPEIVVIHASAFYPESEGTTDDKKLSELLRAFDDTKSKFVIYSRKWSNNDEAYAYLTSIIRTPTAVVEKPSESIDKERVRVVPLGDLSSDECSFRSGAAMGRLAKEIDIALSSLH